MSLSGGEKPIVLVATFEETSGGVKSDSYGPGVVASCNVATLKAKGGGALPPGIPEKVRGVTTTLGVIQKVNSQTPGAIGGVSGVVLMDVVSETTPAPEDTM